MSGAPYLAMCSRHLPLPRRTMTSSLFGSGCCCSAYSWAMRPLRSFAEPSPALLLGAALMCGIAGFWNPSGLEREADAWLRRMTDTISHRGPDDEGQWLDSDAGIALGHRRLSILDLSPEGHQPMVSRDGRW